MYTLFLGILVVGGSQLLAVAGRWIVRRLVSLETLERNHEVAGFFLGVLGTMYAVLLAFVVSVLWTQYQDARVLITREANELGDLSRPSKGFSEPLPTQLRAQLTEYTKATLDEEWPAMANGNESQRAWNALQHL